MKAEPGVQLHILVPDPRSLLDHVNKDHFVIGSALVVRRGVCESQGRKID